MSVYYKWFRGFFGCSKIKIEGMAEKILNVLSEREIYFWGTQVDEDGNLYVFGSVFSAGRIVETALELGLKADVVQRVGLPFVFEKYKKRYGIMVGAVLAWAILFLSSLTVWEVRVASRSGEDPQKICALLEECGLKMGTFLPTLNVRKVENQFLLNNPQYSFFAVNIYGTVANIEIRRASQRGEPEDKSSLCHVVATKDGTIISVEAYGGSPVVKKGERVSAGDMLISSFMEGSFGVVRSVHAYGKVMAAVDYEYVKEIPLDYISTVRTGRETSKTSIRLLCFQGDFYKNEESPYNKTQIVSSRERIDLFGIKLPIEVQKAVYYEEQDEKIILTEKEAEAKAIMDYEMYMEREIKGDIISEAHEVVFDSEKRVVRLKGVFSVVEDIGEKVYLE